MIDNIKIYINDKDEFERSLKLNALISLNGIFDSSTGVAKEYPLKGKFYNMDVVITEKSAFVSGSVHKLYNSILGNEEGNSNDFSYCEYKTAIRIISEALEINPSATKITNLEFGFNIHVKDSPRTLIDNHVIMLNYKEPNRKSNFRGKGCFKEFQMSDYSLKIYDKSLQYNILDENILRVEQKIINRRYLQTKGIFNLADINEKTLNILYVNLYKLIGKLTLVDKTEPPTELRLDKKMLFLNGLNTSYWKSEKDKGGFKYLKRDFEKILNDCSLNSNKFEILDSIRNKYKELLYCDADDHKAA